ncbi:MAG: hypothetical protein H6667_02210 [Ardenticatenaceae bacterium]|nr:hypothetical protein [Ardenticatenaceae bacterium]MCB9443323.1 hypothetical protein [Ardenticatenaceae bacterium]
MNEQRFETGSSPHVVVSECGGALVIGSWKGTAVLAQSAELTANTPNPEQLELASSGDLNLTVPEKASLTIQSCTGPLTIKHVDGFVNVGTAVQAITLNDVGSAKIGTAGKLKAENVNGPLSVSTAQTVKLRNVADVVIDEAADDAAIHFATGAVKIGKAGNRITLHTINGPIIIQQCHEAQLGNLGGVNQVSGVSGTLWLMGGLANGEHRFQTEGDILVAWPADAPLTLVAEGAVIDNRLPLTNATTTKLDDGRSQLTGHIEQGKPFVSLKTSGNIGLKPLRLSEEAALSASDFDFSPPPPTLADVVGTAVSTTFPNATQAQIAQITTAIETHLAQAEQTITPPTPSAGQMAAAKAQQKAEKSLQKAADSITEVQARLTQPPSPEPTEPEPEMPEATAVAPSQTQILQLLKDEAITIEQANLLLDNLHKT